MTLQYITLHYSTSHCITSHYNTLHYITLDCIHISGFPLPGDPPCVEFTGIIIYIRNSFGSGDRKPKQMAQNRRWNHEERSLMGISSKPTYSGVASFEERHTVRKSPSLSHTEDVGVDVVPRSASDALACDTALFPVLRCVWLCHFPPSPSLPS